MFTKALEAYDTNSQTASDLDKKITIWWFFGKICASARQSMESKFF